ncbi:hypothetical protein ACSDQ9_05660 [Aestuariimicrobium soli]|uniref:hypothetical protein n=1 Tax=Aestuariimicrobium soli TaxID=2035834 RepID=UPI003EBE1355
MPALVLYLAIGAVWVGVGQAIRQVLVPSEERARSGLGSTLGWAVAWPILAPTAAWSARQRAEPQPEELHRADPARIAALEKELGMAPPEPEPQPAPPPRVDPPSITSFDLAHSQLPTFGDSNAYWLASHTIEDDPRSAVSLSNTQKDLTMLVRQLEESAAHHDDAKFVAEVTRIARRVGRLERGLGALVPGLSYASFGRGVKTCIDTRGALSEILEDEVHRRWG